MFLEASNWGSEVGWVGSRATVELAFGMGSLVGGGGTAIIQSMGTRNRTLAELTGAEIRRTSAANTPPKP